MKAGTINTTKPVIAGITKEESPSNNSIIPKNKDAPPKKTKIESKPFFPNLYTKNANNPIGIKRPRYDSVEAVPGAWYPDGFVKKEIATSIISNTTITPNIFRSNFPLGNNEAIS